MMEGFLGKGGADATRSTLQVMVGPLYGDPSRQSETNVTRQQRGVDAWEPLLTLGTSPFNGP
jgi:hypothetical protein